MCNYIAINLLTLLTLYPPENQNTKKNSKIVLYHDAFFEGIGFYCNYISPIKLSSLETLASTTL